MDRSAASRIVHRLARRAGIEHHVGCHALRHAFITAALDAGVPLRDVQIAARHADPHTTTRYDRARGNLDRYANYVVAVLLADGTRLPYRPDIEELREACRALKGAPLRQEVYALDGSPEQDSPYLVTESSTAVELLQPMAGQPHAVCLPRPAETVTRHIERRLYAIDHGGPVAALADSRVTHDLVLDVDGSATCCAGCRGIRSPPPGRRLLRATA